MQQQSATPPPAITPAPLAQALDSIKDVVMTDGTPDRPAVSPQASFLYKIVY
jgi:COMPASS component SDC1